MKKNLLSIFLAAMAAMPLASAQKLDRNSLSSITLSGYPQVPIPLSYTTYALIDEARKPVLQPVNNGLWASSPRLQFTKLAEGADIVLHYSGITDYTTPVEVVKEEDVFTFLSKKGRHPKKLKVMGGRFQAYAYKTLAFYVDVTTNEGVVYTDSLLLEKEYVSPLVRNPKRAFAFVDSMLQADASKESLYAFNMKNEAQKKNHSICKALGFVYLDSYRFHVYSVKVGKKAKFDYTDLVKAAADFEQAAAVVDKNDFNLTPFKEQAAPCMEVWQKALANSADPRLTPELQAAILYNMATYYVLSKDFAKAGEFYAKAAKVQPDFADTEKLIKNTKLWNTAQERYYQMMADAQAGNQ